jgi:signal peptidase I
MKAEAVPFYGILVAALTGGTWFIFHYEFFRFRDPTQKQLCQPEITEGTQRLGRDVGWLSEEDLNVGDLARFRTGRAGAESTSRIIALAGQRVAVRSGQLVIDGAEVKDPWGRKANALDFMPEVIVPEGYVFVANDQRWGTQSERMDSRAFGPIPMRSIDYVFTPKGEDK